MKRALIILLFCPLISLSQMRVTNLGISLDPPDFNESNDLSDYSNSSWTPPDSGLVILFGFAPVSPGIPAPIFTSVAGTTGLTWVKILADSMDTGSTTRGSIALYAADATGGGFSAGVTTVGFNIAVQSFTASVFVVDSVDLTGGVLAAFVQTNTSVDNSASTNGTVVLAPFDNSANRVINAFFLSDDEKPIIPRVNWELIDTLDSPTGNARALFSQWRSDVFEDTSSASWGPGTARWGAIAAELKTLIAGFPSIETTGLTNGIETIPYSQPVTAGGGVQPYAWNISAGTLPDGFSLSATGDPSATISGTSVVPSTYNFTVQVTDDSLNTDTQALSITIDIFIRSRLIFVK